jgi:hypothetical protein
LPERWATEGQRFKEGEIVIVTEARPEYRRNGELTERSRVYQLDQSLAYKFVKVLDGLDKLQGIDATIKARRSNAPPTGRPSGLREPPTSYAEATPAPVTSKTIC